MNGKIFTLRNLYQSGTEKLEKAGIREAKLDAWYLLEYKTGISRAVFLADPDREVEEEKAELQSLVSDISHQTKTPIANLKMLNDTMLTLSLIHISEPTRH